MSSDFTALPRKLRPMPFFWGMLYLFLLSGCSLLGPQRQNSAWPSNENPPKRLLILVFDQMRSDFLDRYDLPHFNRIKNQGLFFKNARVGHLTSNTIVSHPVITTGLFPKNLPWSDEVFLDQKGVFQKKGDFYANMELSLEGYSTIWKGISPSVLRTVEGPAESKLVVAQKHYTAYTFSSPTTESRLLTLGAIRKEEPLKGWREPVGNLLLSEFNQPFGGRFFLDANPDYGSKNTVYPFDGNRYALGNDPQHEGGDAWVKDAILTFFSKVPDWKVVLASFGSLDKSLHAFGEHEKKTELSWAIENKLNFESVLQRADRYLGEVLDELEKKGSLSETLIILTSDHGGQANESYYGLHTPKGNHLDWIRGKTSLEALPDVLKPIVEDKNIQALVRDSALRFYLKSKSLNKVLSLSKKARKLPGVSEVYYKKKVADRYYYIRAYRAPDLSPQAIEWTKENHPALLQTMANGVSADVVVLLKDGVGYGFPGDHGGTQERVQRIPFLLWSPNLRKDNPVLISQLIQAPVRLVDIHSMVRALMKIAPLESLDGTSWGIEGLVY